MADKRAEKRQRASEADLSGEPAAHAAKEPWAKETRRIIKAVRSVVPGRHRKVLPATDKGGEDDGTAAVVPQAKRSKRGPAPSDSKQVSVPPAPPPLAEYAAAALKEFPMLSDSELRAEFEELPFVPDGKTSTFALREANEDKNRYCDISAYDDTRVPLKVKANGNPDDSYINANYVPGYQGMRDYIATQGPLPETIVAFWTMVWEQDANLILMLASCIEGGRQKCSAYWPLSNPMDVGRKLTLVMTEEERHPTYRRRAFTLKKGRKSRKVVQLQYTQWPDHGVPEATEIRPFILQTRQERDKARFPVVVHCSAGIGRTGSFIAIDRLLDRIFAQEARLNVRSIVRGLRDARCGMVQTAVQYRFIHQFVHSELRRLAKTEEEAVDSADATARDDKPVLRASAPPPAKASQTAC